MNELKKNQGVIGRNRLVLISLLGVLAAGGLLVLAAVLGSIYGVKGLASYEERRKESADGSWELKQLQAEERKQLNEYKWINKDSLQVQIPIQRAMELLVREAAEETSVKE